MATVHKSIAFQGKGRKRVAFTIKDKRTGKIRRVSFIARGRYDKE